MKISGRLGGSVWVLFFFFQAEDGIRDRTVTGVQTCALQISALNAAVLSASAITAAGSGSSDTPRAGRPKKISMVKRSEERRVGKECRSGWWRSAWREKRE